MSVIDFVQGTDLKSAFETVKKPYHFHNNLLLTRQETYESNARTYPRRVPFALSKAEGIYVQDTEGRVYLDCLCGAGALALGHNHPAVMRAMRKTLDDKVPLLTLDITTPVKDQFVRDMMDALPKNMSSDMKIQFCSPSGADAVEAALKLVKTATGKRGILAFSGSYHGMTHGALSVTSMVSPRAAVPNLMADVVFLPYPYSYRCPFGLGGQAGEQATLHYIEQMLSDPFSGLPPVAGIIIEAIQGEGGVVPASDAWMRALRELTYKHQIPLIVDEIQTGIGRTGAMFSFEHSGITPDVILVSKSIGGSLPLSLILYNKALDKWGTGAHVGTFRGNQLAMAAGSAVLRTIREEGLLENCSTVGRYMFSRLLHLKDRYPIIGDVRGRGLMVAAEIVNPKAAPGKTGYPVWSEMSLRLQQACFKRGLIIELGGRGDSTARFLPPINIDLGIAETILDIFESAIEELNENY